MTGNLELIYNKGLKFLNDGDYRSAIREFTKVIGEFGVSWEEEQLVMINRAIAYINAGGGSFASDAQTDCETLLKSAGVSSDIKAKAQECIDLIIERYGH